MRPPNQATSATKLGRSRPSSTSTRGRKNLGRLAGRSGSYLRPARHSLVSPEKQLYGLLLLGSARQGSSFPARKPNARAWAGPMRSLLGGETAPAAWSIEEFTNRLDVRQCAAELKKRPRFLKKNGELVKNRKAFTSRARALLCRRRRCFPGKPVPFGRIEDRNGVHRPAACGQTQAIRAPGNREHVMTICLNVHGFLSRDGVPDLEVV